MIRSLYSGVSGVRSHQLKMDVVGNNIANVNTVGFKSGRLTFTEHVSQLLKGGSSPRDARGGVNPVQVGLGVKVHSVDNNFGQGGLENTGYATDMAIQGNGFFVVKFADEEFYTRAGNFTIDAEGRLVAANGSGFVQGRMADTDGVVRDSSVGNISIPSQLKTAPKATTEVQIYSNLDADATMATASLDDAGREADATNPLNPNGTGVTSVSGTADDGIGGTHSISITGQNAVNSQESGTNTSAGALTLTTLLVNDLGIDPTTIADGFTVTIDANTDREAVYTVRGLDNNSTVGDLLGGLQDQVAGADFELVGGEIQVTRNYAGDGTEYNVTIDDTTSDIVANVFGAGSFNVNDGTASTLIAVDTFTDNASGAVSASTLGFEADANTGLMTRLVDLGGGGVTVIADQGFGSTYVDPNDDTTANEPIIIETADTEHSTSIQVYDEQGKTHTMSLNFTKTSESNVWRWDAEVGEPAIPVNGNYGTVEFDADGTLRNWNYENNRGAFTFDPGGSEADVTVRFDPGELGTMTGITQTASGFSTSLIGQDGYAMGTLEAIDINSNGEIVGNFTNGQELMLAEIVLANFSNSNGLKRAGDNLWERTDAAGDPIYGLAETNFSSRIERGFLEMSNVDLVKEFTEMITAQRGFQASARVITTSDQILTEVTNLKR